MGSLRLWSIATAVGISIAVPTLAASLRGAFVESPGDAPLAAVEVVLRRAADSTVVAHTLSAANGRFALESLPLGAYLFRASLLGHMSLTRSDIVLTEQVPTVDLGTLSLAVSALDMPGVAITTERATTIVAPDRNIYLTKDMPAAASGTAIDILRTVAELDVDIEGRVSLRGSAGVNIQINGRATPIKGDALTTYLRQFPADRIERIEVIANPSAKFDPEGTAGIVNIVLKEDVDLGLSGSVSLTAGQSYSGPGARIAWQKGPLTLFGGLSANVGNSEYRVATWRQNLLALPVTYLQTTGLTDSKSGYGNVDLSIDYALTKRIALYGTVNSYLNRFDSDALTHYAVLDSAQVASSLYDRTSDSDYDGGANTFTLGMQHVVQKGRDERVAEFMLNDSNNDNLTLGTSRRFLPAGPDDPVSDQSIASEQTDRSWELSDTRPLTALGTNGKLELGYKGSDRRNTKSVRLEYFDGDDLVVTPLSGTADDMHHERFHSGYATLGSTFGRLSLQVGARAEAANTTFEVRSSGRSYDNDYRSLFPSANFAWDFGGGRTTRLTYSKRIERPGAFFLNPEVPSPDSLNRFVGNPALSPKYTHSYGLEASWTGSRGMLQVSPFYRETVDNWDQITRVDSAGVATTTWENASSLRLLGASFTASLRQTQRIGGTLGLSLFREAHDAANVMGGSRTDVTNWSVRGNVTFKATKSLDLQAYLRFNPRQTLAQGRVATLMYSNVSARLKVNEQVSVSLWINDPFDRYEYSLETRDAAHVQTTISRYGLRGLAATLNWAWGKPPEQKQRRQSGEAPQQPDAGAP